MRFDEEYFGPLRDYEGTPTVMELHHRKGDKRYGQGNRKSPAVTVFNTLSIILIIVFAVSFIFPNVNFRVLAGALMLMSISASAIAMALVKKYVNERRESSGLWLTFIVSLIPIVVYNLAVVIKAVEPSAKYYTLAGGLFLSILAIGFLVEGIGFCIYMNVKCNETTTATCIGYHDKRKNHNSRHSGYYVVSCPVYEFEDYGNKYTVFNKKYMSPFIAPQIGSLKTIRYNRNDPNFCMIGTTLISPIITGIIFFLIIGFFATQFFATNKESIFNPHKETYASIETSQEEDATATTEATEQTYTGLDDDDIYNAIHTRDYVVGVYPVTAKYGDYIYIGEEYGAPARLIEGRNTSVGDNALVAYYDGHYTMFRMTSTEHYLGERSFENLGLVDENGRLILNSTTVEYMFGFSYFNVSIFTYDRTEDSVLWFVGEDGSTLSYPVGEANTLYYREFEEGDEVYYLVNAGTNEGYILSPYGYSIEE